MNDFKVTKILDSHTIVVEPSWEMEYNGNNFSGNKINVRGLEEINDKVEVISRLNKILIDTKQELQFDSPELIDSSDSKNAIVSCSVYLGQTNVVYYFPEYVTRS